MNVSSADQTGDEAGVATQIYQMARAPVGGVWKVKKLLSSKVANNALSVAYPVISEVRGTGGTITSILSDRGEFTELYTDAPLSPFINETPLPDISVILSTCGSSPDPGARVKARESPSLQGGLEISFDGGTNWLAVTQIRGYYLNPPPAPEIGVIGYLPDNSIVFFQLGTNVVSGSPPFDLSLTSPITFLLRSSCAAADQGCIKLYSEP